MPLLKVLCMKKYWKSIDELEYALKKEESGSDSSVQDIPDEETNNKLTATRRDFLKLLGFSVGYAVLATSCESPIRKAIPFLFRPEEIIPGVANYYASTFFDGHDYGSILVKTMEGRPIKIEGNELSGISSGGTNARIQASVLSLYDNARLKTPLKNGVPDTWKNIDADIISQLADFAKKGEKIVILTSSVISPSTKQVFADFTAKYPTTEMITYDAVSVSGIIEANNITFKKADIPSYQFSNADLVVSFGADFLGTWISPIEFTRQYAGKRKVSKEHAAILKHVQFESALSLTGSNADHRIPVNPSEEGIILLNLYNKIAQKAGKTTINVPKSPVNIDSLADELWLNKGKSVVLSGSNDVSIQVVVNRINEYLENYGMTIDLENPVYFKSGIDSRMDDLVDRMEKGEIKAVILYNVNPAYDYPLAEKFTSALGKTKLSVSFAETLDETAKISTYVCPDCHYLESWNDAEPRKNSLSLCQPVITKLFDTRQAQESLLAWCATATPGGKPVDNTAGDDSVFYTYIQTFWEKNYYSKQSADSSFPAFWTKCLQNGVFDIPETGNPAKTESILTDSEFGKHVSSIIMRKAEGFEFTIYETVGIGTGKHANNPWLQELPDPVSKVCWDNYVAISYSFAQKYGLKLGDIVIVNNLFELPVLIQPGQADNTVSIALGYGRTSAGKVADSVGKNAFRLIDVQKTRIYSGNDIKLVPTGVNYIMALTQTHHTMEGRDFVHQATLNEYKANPSAGNEVRSIDNKNKRAIYKKREFPGHHWGLAIDLNACTGCSACVIACQAENNVPVIGRDEVRNKRIMHWIRIDRYYSEQVENPEIYFLPVMCQQCNSAPCENVCPVEATQSSKEGLNQMVYNRCVGTKYCMNNCPYRVRRFNWFEYGNNEKFDYTMNSDQEKMVLNPDVVVRSRGIVEKCSFCVQRIQEKKLLAKKENRELADGEIRPACLQSCPARAMIFGDLNNPVSAITKAMADERKYLLLEEVNTLPVVGYLTKIKRTDNI
jgi:Fe-S-cluster-containing dehydrogenase component/anaerobic selenocysteine-containing dehydrogenase